MSTQTRSSYEEDCGLRPAITLRRVGRWIIRISHDECGTRYWTVQDDQNPEDSCHFHTYAKALDAARESHAEDLRENAIRNFHS